MMTKWNKKTCLSSLTNHLNSVPWNGVAHVGEAVFQNRLDTETGNAKGGVPIFD